MLRHVAALSLAGCALSTLIAAAPADEPLPQFSTPTEITNTFVPFSPDSAKVFRGRDGGARTAVIESHLAATRTFFWQGNEIVTRVIEEKEFEAGVLVEISRTYVAQADDGSVWAFGEVPVEFEDGEDIGAEDDAWLVGGPTEPSDHFDIQDVLDPSMFMPATLEVGMTFSREDFPGGAEIIEVVSTDVKLRTPAGKFVHAVRLRETSTPDEPISHLWVAPGVGLISEKAKGVRTKLIATSLFEKSAESVDDQS